MLFQEPPRTQYDWNFQLLGIPVRVHPLFWLLCLLLGLRGNDSRGILIWVAACFVSILIHEFGHALTIRYYGWSPHVVLYSFGGLAIYNPTTSPWQSGGRRRQSAGAVQVLISLAGPGAGFLFAAVIFLLLTVSGSFAFPQNWIWTPRAIAAFFLDVGTTMYFVTIQGSAWRELIANLLFINIYWGLLNLLPIYPLDGGQVSRELFLSKSSDGARQALVLSFVTAAVMAALALLKWQRMYMALLFGYMAYVNYQQLQGPFGGSFFGSGRRRW